MLAPQILVFPASLRPGSYNARLAALAAGWIEAQGASVTRLDLGAYALPLYDARIEADGIPARALALHEHFRTHDGVFIASPEYNSFPPPLLLNALDWISRVKIEGGMAAAFGRPVFALGSASPGAMGGYRALMALRHKLELGLGASVIPPVATVPAANGAFDAGGDLIQERSREALAKVVARLIKAAASNRQT